MNDEVVRSFGHAFANWAMDVLVTEDAPLVSEWNISLIDNPKIFTEFTKILATENSRACLLEGITTRMTRIKETLAQVQEYQRKEAFSKLLNVLNDSVQEPE